MLGVTKDIISFYHLSKSNHIKSCNHYSVYFEIFLIKLSIFQFFVSYSILEIIMKAQIYRLVNQTKSHETKDPNLQLVQVFDNKLLYLNHSFEHNMKIQEFYLDIVKNKRTIHAKELKQYYHIFTNSKAESLMFEHQIHHQSQNFQLNQNREMIYTMKRMYCRLIEKIMVKISFYLMNKPFFNFAYTHASELIKKCETLMRRLNYLKDFSNINEVIQRIFQQNQEFQQYIFDQLICKGYINSVDEFYRINGIDIEHRDVYERNNNTEDQQSKQETLKDRNTRREKYQSNLNKDLIKNSLKKQYKPASESKNHNANINRTGIVDLQAKYKDLIISLDNVITQQQFQQIAEVKQVEEQNEKDQKEEPLQTVAQQKNIQVVQIQPQNENLLTTAQEQIPEEQIQQIQIFKVPNLRLLSKSKTTKLKRQITKKTPQIMSQQYETRSQLHQKQLTIPSLNSSSMIPDSYRERPRKTCRMYTSPLFSKSFVDAIKSIQKSNLIEQSNRLSIKRMSEHIIQFHRKSQKQSLSLSPKSSKQKMSMMQVLKKSNQKKSIIKLLNIYKYRTLENQIGQARKELIETSQKLAEKRRQAKDEKRSQFSDKNQRYQMEDDVNHHSLEPLSKLKDDISIKRKILRNQTKQSIFKRQSTIKLKHLQKLKIKLKQNIEEEPDRTLKMMKKFQYIQNITKSSIFQNFRLSQKVTASNNFKVTQRQNSSLRSSPQKQALQPASILTSHGIQSIDIFKYNQQRKIERLSKTVKISATQSPTFHHFQVYDRVRRIVIK